MEARVYGTTYNSITKGEIYKLLDGLLSSCLTLFLIVFFFFVFFFLDI